MRGKEPGIDGISESGYADGEEESFMALIDFTIDDALDARGDFSGLELVHLEEHINCSGEICGKRPELCLAHDEYLRYCRQHSERPPIGRHWHIVISRNRLGSKQYHFGVQEV